jgi:hypothetical protein
VWWGRELRLEPVRINTLQAHARPRCVPLPPARRAASCGEAGQPNGHLPRQLGAARPLRGSIDHAGSAEAFEPACGAQQYQSALNAGVDRRPEE